MNKSINKEALVEFFENYRAYSVPVGTIAVCILLILLFLLPQVANIWGSRDEYQIEQTKLDAIKGNIAYVSSVDSTKLDSNLKLVSSALPSDKNFEPIFLAISAAAAISGTSVGNFQFNVGNLSASEITEVGIPAIQVNLNLLGGVIEAVAFSQELYKTLPLSAVSSIKVLESGSSISVSFYYKPFNSNIVSTTDPIKPATLEDQEFIDNLATWSAFSSSNNIVPAPAPSSASSSADFPF